MLVPACKTTVVPTHAAHSPPRPVRLALAETHTLLRQALLRLLRADDDVLVVVESDRGEGLVASLGSRHVDVMVLDLPMPVGKALGLIRRVRHSRPTTAILVMSMRADPQFAARVLDAGARGYLTKDRAAQELLLAIHRLAAGQTYVSAAAA